MQCNLIKQPAARPYEKEKKKTLEDITYVRMRLMYEHTHSPSHPAGS